MQQFLLQSPLRRILAAVFMICLIVVSACKDGNDEELAPVTVNFPANGAVTVGEAAGEKSINLALSGGAVKDGTITISATGADGVLTVPTSLSVTKGNTVAILKVTPVNNTTIGGNKDVTLTISAVSDGYLVGTPATYKVTVVDDEGPTTVFFENSEATVSEASATALDVTVSLSAKATAAGSFTVTLDPADAPVTTTPAAVNGVITIPVAVGDESVKFSVIPINNEANSGDAVVTFTLGESETVKVTDDNELTLTITDDDAIVPVTILSVRDMWKGSDVVLPAKTYIKGVVTSASAADGNVTAGGLYVQDASGAMPVFFASAHGVTQGKEILVDLSGVTLTNFSGYLLEATATPNANLTVMGDGTLPTPKPISVAQLNTGDFESQYVKLENVTFPDADGILTMEGTRVVTDGTTSGNVFTRNGASGASFRNEILPLGSGTLIGVASDFTSGPQLLPQVFATDVFPSNPTGTITLDPGTAIDFGPIANGAKSAAQSYDVNVSGLTQDVTVTASANYQVSKTNNDADFASSITLTAATGGEVWVRFVPTTGENKAIPGTVTHKSKGALTRSLSVTGTETGAGSAFQTLALWTFETSKPGGSTTPAGATISGIIPEEGSQTATATASGVHASTATVYSNPVGNGTGESFSSNNWSVDDYYQFTASTTGLKDVKLSWEQTGSASGPGTFFLKYSTDGTTFLTFGTSYSVTQATWSGTTPVTTTSLSFDLSSVTALNNAATIYIRLVNANGTGINGSAIAAAGSGRVDNVKIEARP